MLLNARKTILISISILFCAATGNAQMEPFNYGYDWRFQPTPVYYSSHKSDYYLKKYLRQSYKYFKPGTVRRNNVVVYPYGYTPVNPQFPYQSLNYPQYPQYDYSAQYQQPAIQRAASTSGARQNRRSRMYRILLQDSWIMFHRPL